MRFPIDMNLKGGSLWNDLERIMIAWQDKVQVVPSGIEPACFSRTRMALAGPQFEVRIGDPGVGVFIEFDPVILPLLLDDPHPRAPRKEPFAVPIRSTRAGSDVIAGLYCIAAFNDLCPGVKRAMFFFRHVLDRSLNAWDRFRAVGDGRRIEIIATPSHEMIHAIGRHRKERKERPVLPYRHRIAIDRERGMAISGRPKNKIRIDGGPPLTRYRIGDTKMYRRFGRAWDRLRNGRRRWRRGWQRFRDGRFFRRRTADRD